MRLPFMGPSREEVVAIATDLIARFGVHARDEALRLEDVAVEMRYARNRNLYRRAAREVEKSFAEARLRLKTKPASEAAVVAFLDSLELFGLGYSWGGYASLAIPFDCTTYRTATRFAPGGPTVRFNVGLEDIEDLKADLDRGFTRLRATV